MRATAVSLWVTCCLGSAVAAEPQLLSISDLSLRSGAASAPSASRVGEEYVAAFDIATWGVEVLAVCHVPAAWTVTAGRGIDPAGRLSGQAGGGVAFLHAGNLDQLHALFLVQIDGLRFSSNGDCRRECRPATFAGTVEIGRYGLDTRTRRVRLKPANIGLTPASRCPDP